MQGAPTRIYQGSPTAFRSEAQKRWTPQPGVFDNVSAGDVASAVAHPVKTAVDTAAKLGLSNRTARQMAEFAKLRNEAAQVFTLQGPERDAVARWLVNTVPPGMKKGGRIDQQNGFAHGGHVKATKESVHYRKGHGHERCGVCSMFRKTNECTAVEGRIRPTDLCDLFEAKKPRHEPPH